MNTTIERPKNPMRLEVELLEPAMVRPMAPKLEGVTVGGLQGRAQNGPMPNDWWFVLPIEVAVNLATSVVGSWLYEYLKQYRAKRIRLNGREPVDEADFQRIFREELEIGKND
jgi:hypothetical protein